MCGRFTLRQAPEAIAKTFQQPDIEEHALTPQYNIAPTQAVATIVLDSQYNQPDCIEPLAK
jgi:putative SOS response-associated peptidase YedK